MCDDSLSARDFHSVVKPAIDDLIGREMTFDILFHNSEHQATLLRYGVKKSEQVSGRRFYFTVRTETWFTFLSGGLEGFRQKYFSLLLVYANFTLNLCLGTSLERKNLFQNLKLFK